MDHDNAHDLKLVCRKSIGIILSSVLKNSPPTPHTKYGVTCISLNPQQGDEDYNVKPHALRCNTH